MVEEVNKQKKKRYWLWGGIIIGGINLAMIIFTFLSSKFHIYSTDFFNIIKPLGGAENILQLIVNTLFNLVIYFLIGALLGYIYGKIKNRGIK